nr:GNAT family N-acetyltransferase [Marivita sp. S6314]
MRITPGHLSQPLAIVRKDNAVAGLIALELGGDAPEISKLFVDPAYMRQGVGTVLITWAMEQAARAGHASVRIEADPGAVPFYAAHGAVQVGETPSEVIPNRLLPVLTLPTTRP